MSEITSERSKLSTLAEMHSHVLEAADYAAPNAGWKERVTAAARVLNLGWERAKGFYYGTARRVDAEEMDNARAAIRALREQRERRQTAEHIAWVGRTLGYLTASDPDLYRPEIAALERALSAVGQPDRALADPAVGNPDATTPATRSGRE